MKGTRTHVIVATILVAAIHSGCTFTWQTPPSTAIVVTPTPAPSPSASATDFASQPSPSPVTSRVKEIQSLEEQVSLLRGLSSSTEIALSLLAPAGWRAEAVEFCLAQRPEDALGPKTLSMLGLLRSEVDLDATYATLANDWAAGLTHRYDEQSRSIHLVDAPALDATARLDYITSYLSALRADAFAGGRTGACCPIACALEDDAGLARAAFVLGDDRLAQEQWVRVYGVAEDSARLQALLDPASEAGLRRAPQYLESAYDLALTGGKAFVQRLYISGGWAAVDAAYLEPPSSTEQILHPERYPEDVPLPLQTPDLAEALGPIWELDQVNTLGEWRIRRMLEAFLPIDEAADAAADWGNDVLLSYHNRELDEDMLIMIARWDNLRQAQDFFLAFRAYGEVRFGERHPTQNADTWTWEDGFSLLERVSDQTLWILAPDEATAQAARGALTFPVPDR